MHDRLTALINRYGEVGLLRIVFGVWATTYVAVRSQDLIRQPGVRSSWAPIGVMRLLGIEPYSRGVAAVLVVATLIVGVAFTLGWRLSTIGPLFAVMLLVVLTYRLSWGKIFHTEHQLMVDVAVLGAAGSTADRGARKPEDRAHKRRHDAQWVVRLLAVLTVAGYFVAGLAKLRNGGFGWATGGDLRNWVAVDNLRKIELGDRHSPVGAAMTAWAWPWPPLAVLTLVLELGAPLAMLGGRTARMWCVAAWAFHVGVLAFMAILFPFPLSGAAFLPVWLLSYRRHNADRSFSSLEVGDRKPPTASH